MDELISQLKIARDELERNECHVAEIEEELSNTELAIKLADYKRKKLESSDAVSRLEEKVRGWAVALYQEKKDKHPHPKVEIKLFTNVEITDQDKALKWAVINDPSAVKLNANKLAKDAGKLELDFLKKTEEPRAQIASKLD